MCGVIINTFKDQDFTGYIWTFSPYRAANTLSLS